MTLVVVLPPLAHSLDRLGWAEIAAARIAPLGSILSRTLVAFVTWLGISALLTLDVAAVVAAPVGMAVAGRSLPARRAQLEAAVVGSNLGSLIFPFSNLTNLLVVAGTGVGFAAFVRSSVAPQILAIVAATALLALRARRQDQVVRERSLPQAEEHEAAVAETEAARRSVRDDRPALIGATIAGLGALAAIAVGFAGGNVSIVFAVVAGLVSGLALAAERVKVRGLARTIPIIGIVVVLGAFFARDLVTPFAGGLPSPAELGSSPAGLVIVALVGGILAATINNLPAAAFGAIWLAGSGVGSGSGIEAAPVIAYLIGTNIVCLATPHGSLATILARSLAATRGHRESSRFYLSYGWHYAVTAGGAALLALIVLR